MKSQLWCLVVAGILGLTGCNSGASGAGNSAITPPVAMVATNSAPSSLSGAACFKITSAMASSNQSSFRATMQFQNSCQQSASLSSATITIANTAQAMNASNFVLTGLLPAAPSNQVSFSYPAHTLVVTFTAAPTVAALGTVVLAFSGNPGLAVAAPYSFVATLNSPPPPPAAAVVLPIVVTAIPGSSTCGYANAPCVSVTICSPTSATTCTTIPNILLDSGSVGLRLFSSLIPSNLNLTMTTVAGKTIAECIEYGDARANWGAVASATVQLAAGVSATVPIQLINAAFAPGSNPQATCKNESTTATPAAFGLNGILGVGPLVNDAGEYFSCSPTLCTRISLAAAAQVSNPIALLASTSYNNGITLVFPSVGASGASAIVGSAILGIGTNSSNAIPPGVNVYPLSLTNQETMQTQFNGSSLSSLLDTGSNGYFFDDSSIATCAAWYCPAATLSLTANNLAAAGYRATTFNLGNADTLFNSNNGAFSNLGAPIHAPYFDWGLPFFYGRTVFIGINGRSSSLGTGPYWAFK